jgi:hypothetical protein
MTQKFTTLAALTTLAAGLALGACAKSADPPKSQRQLKMKIGDQVVGGDAAVTAKISTFDPNADTVLDLDQWGSEHPDEYGIQQAFFAQFGNMDQCVLDFKGAVGTKKQLRGDVHIAVKLNPAEQRPFGVNAKLPKKYNGKKKLKECLREAAASAGYPSYNGPPRVVEFDFELDAGSEWVD